MDDSTLDEARVSTIRVVNNIVMVLGGMSHGRPREMPVTARSRPLWRSAPSLCPLKPHQRLRTIVGLPRSAARRLGTITSSGRTATFILAQISMIGEPSSRRAAEVEHYHRHTQYGGSGCERRRGRADFGRPTSEPPTAERRSRRARRASSSKTLSSQGKS